MFILDNIESSLIKSVLYDAETKELTIYFKKYFVDELTYINVPVEIYIKFSEVASPGKFYLHLIKPNYKQKNHNAMADEKKLKTTNQCSDEKRFIKIRINTDKVNKKFIFIGENGKYLDMTLQMLPNGELDRFGNLGMVTQDVPTSVYKEEVKKKIPADKRTKGEILGNALEFEREGGAESTPGKDTGKMADDGDFEDLPF